MYSRSHVSEWEDFQLKAAGILKMPEDYQSIMTYLNLADDYFKEKECEGTCIRQKRWKKRHTV